MDRFVSPVSYLAAFGGLMSGPLVFLHYCPDLGGNYLCNGTFLGSYNAINESSYSTLFGFPIAAYGLFFYLVIWWTMLVADYTEGSYSLAAFTLLGPLIVLAFVVDLVLVVLLIKLRQFCFLYFVTYAINLSLFLVFLLWLKWLVKRDEISAGSLKALLRNQCQSPEGKAASFFTCSLLHSLASRRRQFEPEVILLALNRHGERLRHPLRFQVSPPI
jgi:uncharacterized membrane protein